MKISWNNRPLQQIQIFLAQSIYCIPIILAFLSSLQHPNENQLKVSHCTAGTPENRLLWKLEWAVKQMYFSSQVVRTLLLKCLEGENPYFDRWWMCCHWQSLLHRRLLWKWSWADPAWQCPLPLLSMRKTFLKSNFSGPRTVSPLAAAVGSIWKNLGDVVNAFKSTVIDFKGSLSKCLSLRFQAVWDSLKHWICSHYYLHGKSPEEVPVLLVLEFVSFFFSSHLLLYHGETLYLCSWTGREWCVHALSKIYLN